MRLLGACWATPSRLFLGGLLDCAPWDSVLKTSHSQKSPCHWLSSNLFYILQAINLYSLRALVWSMCHRASQGLEVHSCFPLVSDSRAHRRSIACRQAGSGYFCQAPQQPTYNFSSSGASGPGLPTSGGSPTNNNNNNNGRRLSQAAAPAPSGGAGQCNQIAYYAPCGELIVTDLGIPTYRAGSWCAHRRYTER